MMSSAWDHSGFNWLTPVDNPVFNEYLLPRPLVDRLEPEILAPSIFEQLKLTPYNKLWLVNCYRRYLDLIWTAYEGEITFLNMTSTYFYENTKLPCSNRIRFHLDIVTRGQFKTLAFELRNSALWYTRTAHGEGIFCPIFVLPFMMPPALFSTKENTFLDKVNERLGTIFYLDYEHHLLWRCFEDFESFHEQTYFWFKDCDQLFSYFSLSNEEIRGICVEETYDILAKDNWKLTWPMQIDTRYQRVVEELNRELEMERLQDEYIETIRDYKKQRLIC